jgi:chromosome segregation ATPase
MSRAEEFETTTKSRAEELKALAIAKKVIKEATGAASSFVQVASTSGVGNTDAVRVVRDLAHKMNSPALAQLASRMASVVGAGGPFKKIKALIGDMIATLEAEAEADATEKAWCDRNLADANENKAQKTAEIEKLTTRIDKATALSDTLKEEVATLQNELAKLAKSQVEMDKLRGEEKAAYDESKATNEKGLNGIKTALKVLREYYAKDASHDAADGASSSIISLLEVVESDITKTLASLTSEEETAIAEYESETKKNEIDRTTKEQDVKYKTKESKDLDKATAENTADRSVVESELDTVNELLAKLEKRCVAKAETYEERKRRREEELAGLKQALDVLENETAFVQKMKAHRTLRGAGKA